MCSSARRDRIRMMGMQENGMTFCCAWGLLATFVFLPIVLGCHFGIYAPIVNAEFTEVRNCQVESVVVHRIGARAVTSGDDDSGGNVDIRCNTRNSAPMPVAAISYLDDRGVRQTDGLACATQVAHRLSSWAWGIGCPGTGISQGSGYGYQRHKERPPYWWCYPCPDRGECAETFGASRTQSWSTCRISNGAGERKYVLIEGQENWYSKSEYQAMWIFGFGFCILPPYVVCVWFIITSILFATGLCNSRAHRRTFQPQTVQRVRTTPRTLRHQISRTFSFRSANNPAFNPPAATEPAVSLAEVGRRPSVIAATTTATTSGLVALPSPTPTRRSSLGATVVSPTPSSAGPSFDMLLSQFRSATNANDLSESLQSLRTLADTNPSRLPSDARQQVIEAGQQFRAHHVELWVAPIPGMFGQTLQAMAAAAPK